MPVLDGVDTEMKIRELQRQGKIYHKLNFALMSSDEGAQFERRLFDAIQRKPLNLQQLEYLLKRASIVV